MAGLQVIGYFTLIVQDFINCRRTFKRFMLKIIVRELLAALSFIVLCSSLSVLGMVIEGNTTRPGERCDLIVERAGSRISVPGKLPTRF